MSNPVLHHDPTAMPGHPSLEETAAFAATLHAGHTDKAGAPYIDHLMRVSRHLVRLFPRVTPVERHAAWLHDALEDTGLTTAELRGRGYAPEVIAIIEAVTPPVAAAMADDPSFDEWITELAVRGPRGALKVQIADLTDDSHPDRLAYLDPDHAASLLRRYSRASDRLLAALDAPQGALTGDDDPDDTPVPLLLSFPAIDHWTIGEAARLADRDLASFAVEELTGLAHRIVAQGTTKYITLERDRQAAERRVLDGFGGSARKYGPIDQWAVRQAAREARGGPLAPREAPHQPRAVPPKPPEPPRGS